MCSLLLELLWFYLTQQGDMCVYNNFSIYTFLYFFLYSSVSVSNWTWILTDVQLQLIIIWIISASFLCLFVKSTWIMKNVVPRSVTNLLNCSVLRHMYGNIRIVNPYVHGTEKAMAPHSSTFAWKIPWTEEPGRLQSRGLWSQTWLSDFTFMFQFHALEKEMATRSSVLAWRIPGVGEPGGLPSMGLHRIGHDWSHLAAAADTCWTV